MQVSALQSVINTNTFKDFHIPNSALCQSLQYHTHTGSFESGALQQQHFEESKKKNGFKKILPLAGAVIGTVLPLIILNKTKGKTLNANVLRNGKVLEKMKEVGEYFEIDGVKEILSTAGGAIAGGLLGGVISDKDKENRKAKIKNSVFEMVNITVPTLFVAGAGKLLKSAKMNPALKKVLPIALGVGLGVPVASKISGAINKKAFKEDKTKQRHFSPKDYIVHIDDIVSAFALSKVPLLSTIPFDKILALIYIHCGYEAGSSDVKDHGCHHH